MTKEKLQEVLTLHLAWLKKQPNGVRANLSGADLYEANLSRANLSRADLSGANLSRADLSRANLSGANLYEANLSAANLSIANLYEANLFGADLSAANLSIAYLSRANFSEADFKILQCFYGKHHGYATKEIIRIGCIEKSHKDWLAEYKTIGKKENYTDFEIRMYGSFIKMAIAWAKQLK